MVKDSIIDGWIDELWAAVVTRAEILEILKKEKLLPQHVQISGLNQRMDRGSINPLIQRKALDEKLQKIYEEITTI